MTFSRTAALLCLAIVALPLASCGDSEFKEGFDEGFDRSARESFIKSCTAQITKVDTQTATELCGCMSDYMSERLTRAEMLNPVSDRADKVSEEATDACIAKLVPQTPS